jgi:hypothetical protein
VTCSVLFGKCISILKTGGPNIYVIFNKVRK